MFFFWRGNTFAHPPKRTFVKSGSPSLTRGMEGKVRSGFMISVPFWRVKRLDMTTRRSEVFFTGRKRLRGTLTPVEIEINNLSFFPLSLSLCLLPTAPWKFLMAAPAAVSNWITFVPPFNVCNMERCISSQNTSVGNHVARWNQI